MSSTVTDLHAKKKHAPYVPETMEMKEFTFRAVLIGLSNVQTPYLLRKAPALRHQHSAKRDERVLLGLIEAQVQGLGRLDDLPEICRALR